MIRKIYFNVFKITSFCFDNYVLLNFYTKLFPTKKETFLAIIRKCSKNQKLMSRMASHNKHPNK